jgi:hypothetical protein
MAEQKDTTSFFRKVVKFVANPSTEWAELDAPIEDTRESDYAKGELKAMIERKRRNDFVRKREFDMLRKVRREGLTGEQLAALGGSSRIDDSQPRISDQPVRQDAGVKAKIDEIEQQMVGENYATTQRRTPEFYNAPTQPALMDGNGRPLPAPPAAPAPAPSGRGGGTIEFVVPAPIEAAAAPARPRPAAPSRPVSLAPIHLEMPGAEAFDKAFAASSTEVTHDPDLDEAVIAFANADFEQCEESLVALTRPGGSRAQHAETWLVVFDLYRAIGQQQKFESLALDYAQQFGWSAPQWFSMPKLVAEAVSDERPTRSGVDAQVGWACPSYLDADEVARLASLSLQMPLPWVFDWSALQTLDVEASGRLSELFRTWIPQDLDMRWLSGERLFAVIQEAAPNGVRDADPAFWQLRLDALRMANRADQFDEAAIDYCVTYEVSPPSWEPARCVVRITGSNTGTTQPPLSMISDVSTTFQESQITEDSALIEVGTVELSGQLVGDIGPTLKKMDVQLASSKIVNVSCARLIRVDFIAAGDLLNWVLARRTENRTVRFVEAHRMVALFFGAMGINEHATVKVRTV